MRPEWTDAEKGEAAGIAHRAAYLTVCPEPPEGWRNSYSHDLLMVAHMAAHRALKVYPDGGLVVAGSAYASAWAAIAFWDRTGRPILGQHPAVSGPRRGPVRWPGGADGP